MSMSTASHSWNANKKPPIGSTGGGGFRGQPRLRQLAALLLLLHLLRVLISHRATHCLLCLGGQSRQDDIPGDFMPPEGTARLLIAHVEQPMNQLDAAGY